MTTRRRARPAHLLSLSASVVLAAILCAPYAVEVRSAHRVAGPYALVVKGGAYGDYTLSLVSLDGRVVAQAAARGRSLIQGVGGVAVPLPSVATSADRAYYLDGDRQVRYLTPQGSNGQAATLDGGAHVHAAFGVSADDKRIAVTTVDYSGPTPVMHLTVRPLSGSGGTTTPLFSSSSIFEWPAGFYGAALVLAVLQGSAYVRTSAGNPANAFDGYHVVDATRGLRRAVLCPQGDAVGPLVAAGTLCILPNGDLTAQSLAGTTRRFSQTGISPVLSPDGSRIAASDGHYVFVLDASGKRTTTAVPGLPRAWIDANHLFIANGFGASARLAILDPRSGSVSVLAVTGQFAGVLPGSP